MRNGALFYLRQDETTLSRNVKSGRSLKHASNFERVRVFHERSEAG